MSQYYVKRGDNVQGPITLERLRKEHERGVISDSDKVRREDSEGWISVGTYLKQRDELEAVQNKRQPAKNVVDPDAEYSEDEIEAERASAIIRNGKTVKNADNGERYAELKIYLEIMKSAVKVIHVLALGNGLVALWFVTTSVELVQRIAALIACILLVVFSYFASMAVVQMVWVVIDTEENTRETKDVIRELIDELRARRV